MLVRFSAQNLFSFKEQIEFNTLPGNSKRLSHHKHKLTGNKEVMRFAAIYGANGSGKSNLIKAIALLRDMVLKDEIPSRMADTPFKLSPECQDLPTELAIEISVEGHFYYYEIAIKKQRVEREYFAQVGANNEDILLFKREGSELRFNEAWENTSTFAPQAQLIRKDLMKPEKPLLALLSTFSSSMYEPHRQFRNWLDERLSILFPGTQLDPEAFIRALKEDDQFLEFANQLMPTLSTGIQNLSIVELDVSKKFGDDIPENLKEHVARLHTNPDLVIGFSAKGSDVLDFVLTNEEGNIIAKKILTHHSSQGTTDVHFHLQEESDGTRRMIDYLPMLYSLLHEEETFIVDELERSIHPLLIKEWLEKISGERQIKGQLIFTTHESNLLDQNLFRPDEIWFAEKNNEGATTFYPLSDFREHHTLDIRKGYLNGRYGAIPFLGDLETLNWHEPATHEAE